MRDVPVLVVGSTDDRLDAGPLSSYLSKVKSWLDANPDEGM